MIDEVNGLPESEHPPEDTTPISESTDEVPAEVSSRSRRPLFENLRRQLTNEELTTPGVPKLLLDMLENAEADRDDLRNYVDLFHSADKRASILAEKLIREKSNEVYFAVGIGLGGAITGLTPFFWKLDTSNGVACLIVGVLLIVGAMIGRVVRK